MRASDYEERCDWIVERLLGRDADPEQCIALLLALGLEPEIILVRDDGTVALEVSDDEIARRLAVAIEARDAGRNVFEAIERGADPAGRR
jgi:hypothetical protein